MRESGILPVQHLRRALRSGAICAEAPLLEGQLQPNSLDLRVGKVAHRARYSFLPVHAPVEEYLRQLSLGTLDLSSPEGALLETGKVYIVPLLEGLALDDQHAGSSNPKSSTGRLDLFVRLLVDGGSMFDAIPAGYHGKLYLEIVPRAFPIRLRAGDTLAQLRLSRNPAHALDDGELREEINKGQLILSDDGHPIAAERLAIDDGVFLTVKVATARANETIGYVAKRTTPAVDLRRLDHPRRQYWHYISTPAGRLEHLILHPDHFYIFASRERVIIPPHLCAEMVPYDAKSGELRTHYAGFFDSGFGLGTGGARVVLEVRNLDVPFLLQDGQRLFRLRYFRNVETPETLYGANLRSNYQGQDLRLSKHFGSSATAPSPQLTFWRDWPRG